MMLNQPSLLVSLLLLLVAGCATTPYGNYVDDDATSQNTAVIASDAAYQLMQLYPPASTKINMQHPTTDPFGVAFMENLRKGGYAIQEHVKTSLAQPDQQAVKPSDGIRLAYIFDQSSGLYRLSVMIDEQILTRAYVSHQDTMQPAGSWVMKE